jgi:hypothetical protein
LKPSQTLFLLLHERALYDERVSEKIENANTSKQESQIVRQVFDDFNSRSNIVGLYDLLYKIDKRVNPHLYDDDESQATL